MSKKVLITNIALMVLFIFIWLWGFINPVMIYISMLLLGGIVFINAFTSETPQEEEPTPTAAEPTEITPDEEKRVKAIAEWIVTNLNKGYEVQKVAEALIKKYGDRYNWVLNDILKQAEEKQQAQEMPEIIEDEKPKKKSKNK